jgi:DNA-binding SARP family transcriptional activator
MIDARTTALKSVPAERRDTGPGQYGLRLRLLGGFAVWVDGKPANDGAWRRRKVSRLMKLLALASGHQLHREHVEGLLWPTLDPRAASQNLHHTLYRARHALEPDLQRRAEPRFLRLRNDLLELAPCDSVESDLDTFEQAAATALASRDVALYSDALALFAGELLPEERFEDWAFDRRDAVKATYVELLLELAELERTRTRLAPAIEALKRIVAVEPLHEYAHAQLIHLDGLAGRRHLAVAHYQRLRNLLRSELGADPLPTTIEIYQSVISGRICPELDRDGHHIHRDAVTGPNGRASSLRIP